VRMRSKKNDEFTLWNNMAFCYLIGIQRSDLDFLNYLMYLTHFRLSISTHLNKSEIEFGSI
jgi:hypothetical protein